MKTYSFLAMTALIAACGEPAPVTSEFDVEAKQAPVSRDDTVVDVLITDAIIRPPLGGKAITAGYFTIMSPKDDAIVAVRSSVSETVELHTHEKEGDLMRMRRVESVPVAANREVFFKPKGLHLMMFGVSPLEIGQEVAVSLEFASGKSVEHTFIVQTPEITPATGEEGGHQH